MEPVNVSYLGKTLRMPPINPTLANKQYLSSASKYRDHRTCSKCRMRELELPGPPLMLPKISEPRQTLTTKALQDHQSSLMKPNTQSNLKCWEWLNKIEAVQEEDKPKIKSAKVVEEEQGFQRPWWMWCICGGEIIAAIWYTGRVTHDILERPGADPNMYIWQLFFTFLSILVRFVMGIGLLVGLKSGSDPIARWYCKVWIGGQCVFFGISIIEIVVSCYEYSWAPASKEEEHLATILTHVVVFTLRVISFALVRQFCGKLKSPGNGSSSSYGELPAGLELRREHADVENQKRIFGTGETSYCGPQVALLMSM